MAIVQYEGKPGQGMTLQAPLTFADVALHVSRFPTPCMVQARIKGEVICGRLVELGSPNGPRQFFKVHTALGEQWVAAWNARLCSGDGRCSCEGSGREASLLTPLAAAAGTPLSPLSNTGVTRVGCA